MMLLTAVFEKVTVLSAKLPGSTSFEAVEDQPERTGIEELQMWRPRTGLMIKARTFGLEGETKDVYEDTELAIPHVPAPEGAEGAAAEQGMPDLERLSAQMVSFKERFPEHEKAVLVVANDVRYESIVQVMDTVRERAELHEDGDRKSYTYTSLFPDVSLSQRFQEEMFLTTPDEETKGG